MSILHNVCNVVGAGFLLHLGWYGFSCLVALFSRKKA